MFCLSEVFPYMASTLFSHPPIEAPTLKVSSPGVHICICKSKGSLSAFSWVGRVLAQQPRPWV